MSVNIFKQIKLVYKNYTVYDDIVSFFASQHLKLFGYDVFHYHCISLEIIQCLFLWKTTIEAEWQFSVQVDTST